MESVEKNEQNKKILNGANLEDKNRVSGNLRRASAGSISKLRRDDQLSLLTLTHANLGLIRNNGWLGSSH